MDNYAFFDHILIVVSNLERSIEFYKSIGFIHKRTIQRENDRVAVMEMGNIKIEMMNLPNGMETYRKSRIDTDIGFRHIGIKVNNLKKVYARLKEKIDFDSPPRPIKNRPGRFTVFFKDPDGIELHFVQEEK